MFPSPGYSPHPGIKPRSPALLADTLPVEPQGNMPRNEEMLSFPLLFSQDKASQEYTCVFCDVFHYLCYLLIFFFFFFAF